MTNSFEPIGLINGLLTYSKMFLFPLIAVIAIPLTLFILHPLFHNYTPSMLKRVGAGTFLRLMALIGFLVIDIMGNAKNKTAVCIMQSNSTLLHIPIDVHFSLLPSFLKQAGCLLIELYSLEFMIAQAPAMMKGFIIGLWFSGQAFVFSFLHIVFENYRLNLVTPPKCGIIFLCIIISIIMFVSVVYLILSKRYTVKKELSS